MAGLRRFVRQIAAILGSLFANLSGAVAEPALAAHAEGEGFVSGQYTLRDGARLAYARRAGEPTLVLVPGTGADRSQYFKSGFIARLPESLGVIVVEMRGRGQSWPPPSPDKASVEHYADDVLELVAGLKTGPWLMGGKSLGGMIALEVAGRNPANLRGAVLLEGWVHHLVASEAFGEDKPSGRPAKAKNVPAGWTEEQELALITMWTRWGGGERAAARARCPLLAIVGDRNLSPRPSQSLLRFPAKPNLSLHWVKGSGHDVLAPAYVDEVADAVNAFVREIARFAR